MPIEGPNKCVEKIWKQNEWAQLNPGNIIEQMKREARMKLFVAYSKGKK
jgi:hypothetical protein